MLPFHLFGPEVGSRRTSVPRLVSSLTRLWYRRQTWKGPGRSNPLSRWVLVPHIYVLHTPGKEVTTTRPVLNIGLWYRRSGPPTFTSLYKGTLQRHRNLVPHITDLFGNPW